MLSQYLYFLEPTLVHHKNELASSAKEVDGNASVYATSQNNTYLT